MLVKTLKRHRYNGQMHEQGEEYEIAQRKDLRLLEAVGRIRCIPETLTALPKEEPKKAAKEKAAKEKAAKEKAAKEKAAKEKAAKEKAAKEKAAKAKASKKKAAKKKGNAKASKGKYKNKNMVSE